MFHQQELQHFRLKISQDFKKLSPYSEELTPLKLQKLISGVGTFLTTANEETGSQTDPFLEMRVLQLTKLLEKDAQKIAELEQGLKIQRRLSEDSASKLQLLNLQRKKDQDNLQNLESTVQKEMLRFTKIIEVFKQERDQLQIRNLQLKDLNRELNKKLNLMNLNQSLSMSRLDTSTSDAQKHETEISSKMIDDLVSKVRNSLVQTSLSKPQNNQTNY